MGCPCWKKSLLSVLTIHNNRKVSGYFQSTVHISKVELVKLVAGGLWDGLDRKLQEAALLCAHRGNCRGRIVSINSLCHVIVLFQTSVIAIYGFP